MFKVLLLFTLSDIIYSLNAAFFMDMVYNNTYGSNTYYGLNIHSFVSRSNNYIHEIDNSNTEYTDAITFHIHPSKIITVSTQFEYVVADNKSTAIFYSKEVMTSSLIASILLVSPLASNLDNFLSHTLLEKLDSQNVSYPVNWKNSSSIILRKNLYPNYNFCYMQLQTYDIVNTISLKHPDIQQMTFHNHPTFQHIFNSTEMQVIFYTNSSTIYNLHPLTITNQLNILHLPFNTSIVNNAVGFSQNICSFSNISNFNSCYNDDSTVSSDNKTCSMIQDDLSYCTGIFDTSAFNATRQCCACNGGYNTYKTIIQKNDGSIRDTNVVYLEQIIDEPVSVNSTDLYLVEMKTSFPMDCATFTSSTYELFGTTYENVFRSSLGAIFQYTQKINATESSTCYSKITSRYYDIENALNIYNYLKRLLKIHENQSTPLVNIYAVPYFNYIVDINSINVQYSQRLQNTSCVATMDVNATTYATPY